MTYVSKVLEDVKNKYGNELEFVESVSEVLLSLEDFIEEDPKYEKYSVLETLTTPDRIITFRVPWYDDNGNKHINTGYRVEWSNACGPYKGGIRFRDNVNLSILKFLAFEQTFKNALTGLLIGGAKGGSDFDPKGKSENEIRSFCQSFMTELYKYIGVNKDVPAGDIGVSSKEIGYMFGQYKRLTNTFDSALTGKGLSYGGSLGRKEATGYGLLYLASDILEANNISIKGKNAIFSGSGNVSIYAMEKAKELGMNVIACSDSNGYIYDKNGIDINLIKFLKEENRMRLSEYTKYNNNATYVSGKKVFEVPCDICFPCATQNEIDICDITTLKENGLVALFEGANMPSTSDAIKFMKDNDIIFVPGKASNSGGVSCSVLEMSQDQVFVNDEFKVVDDKLKSIMHNIFVKLTEICKEYNLGTDYQTASNILGFKRVADAIIEQGL